MKKEFILTADYFSNESMCFVSKIYAKEVGREGIFEFFSLASFFKTFAGKSVRFTVQALDFFALFLFDYLEKNGSVFGYDYSCLITEKKEVLNVIVGPLSFVSFQKRTCLKDDYEKISINADGSLIDLLKIHSESLERMDQTLQMLFALGLKKSTFSANIRKEFCAGDKRRQRYLFPQLPAYAADVCFDSYKGGRLFVNPSIRGDALRYPVDEYDIVSAYPFYMKEFPMPYGEPVRFEGQYTHDPRRPFFIQKIRAELSLKDGCFPSLLLKNEKIFGKTRYITDTDGRCVTFSVTSVELAALMENYTFRRLEYLGGYKFRAASGLFDEYLSRWFSVKNSAPRGSLKYHFSKHMLDNLGGFLGTRDVFNNLAPVLTSDGYIKFRRLPPSAGHSVFCPPIAATTSLLRASLSSIINSADILYAATDSFHIAADNAAARNTITAVFPEGDDLGNVRRVRHYEFARYLAPNFYIARTADALRVVAAGVPRKYNNLLAAEMRPGAEIEIPGFVSITPRPGGAELRLTRQKYRL